MFQSTIGPGGMSRGAAISVPGATQFPAVRCPSSAQHQAADMLQTIKYRRNRTVFTEHHLTSLETSFAKQKYLSTKQRSVLASRLGLTATQVKTWYQNRRMKWKKQVYIHSTFSIFCQCYTLPNSDEGLVTVCHARFIGTSRRMIHCCICFMHEYKQCAGGNDSDVIKRKIKHRAMFANLFVFAQPIATIFRVHLLHGRRAAAPRVIVLALLQLPPPEKNYDRRDLFNVIFARHKYL